MHNLSRHRLAVLAFAAGIATVYAIAGVSVALEMRRERREFAEFKARIGTR